MVVLRHVARDGSPAYLTFWKRSPRGFWAFVRLIYDGEPSFEREWGRGVDVLPDPLDAEG